MLFKENLRRIREEPVYLEWGYANEKDTVTCVKLGLWSWSWSCFTHNNVSS